MNTARYAREAISDRMSLYSSSSINTSGVKCLGKQYPNKPIAPTSPLNSTSSIMECTPLETDGQGNIVARDGRKMTLKGINVDSAMKLPTSPSMPSYSGDPTDWDNVFFEGDTVSFVGRPFPLDEATEHLMRIKSWGYNTIRYLVTWEALEHAGPGIYDEEFIDYTIKTLEIIGRIGGLYVFLELHQDVWSRYCGGSGAPMWTLYCCGLEPRRFTATEAAILHNEPRWRNEETYPKMLWVSNYHRLAAMTMFTLFFSGKTFFPGLEVNGVNIQDYLQDRYFGAIAHFWSAVNKKVPELVRNGTIFGFETMNEPYQGLFGREHLDAIPECQHLRLGTTPTAFQSMQLGSGLAVEVDEYKIAVTGPQKCGRRVVDPKGQSAWLSPDELATTDAKYGWTRSGWTGSCIYASVGIWSDQGLLVPDYFHVLNNTTYTTEYFINHHFVDFFIRFKETVRAISPNVFVLMLPPVLQVPPKVKTDPRHVVDSKTIFCPHYYDGMSLMFKSWNTKFNVDTLGIMRGRYLNPVLGIVFGERAIRNCIKKQFIEIRRECEDNMGPIPCLMSETGMPFDMDHKRAYQTGRYPSQTGALDALSYALEGANMHHTYWCYNSVNCHKWGDRWNDEDFSFWSPDDRDKHQSPPSCSSRVCSRRSSIKAGTALIKAKVQRKGSRLSLSRFSVDSDKDDDLESDYSVASSTPSVVRFDRKCLPTSDGVRAPSAVIRPYVMATLGSVVAAEFDMKTVKYALSVKIDPKDEQKVSSTPTVIFVPKWHFTSLNYGDIYLSSGYVRYNEHLEYLEWFHSEDPQEDQEEDVSPTDLKEKVYKPRVSVEPRVETIVVRNSGERVEEREEKGFGECIIV